MKKNLGFSLLEILIAVVILGISALFLAKLNGVAQSGNTNANERQVATRTAEGIMESLRQHARSKTSLSATPTLNNVTFNTGTGAAADPYAGSFNGQTSVFTVNLSFDPSPNWTTDNSNFNAQVQITWKDRENKTQNVLLVSSLLLTPTTEIIAPSIPAYACNLNWNNGTNGRCFAQGSYRKHGNSLFYCKKNGGCNKPESGSGNPSNQGADMWLEITTCNGTPKPYDAAVPDGMDGSSGMLLCSEPVSSAAPTTGPTTAPTAAPSAAPTAAPSAAPTTAPTAAPTAAPSISPTLACAWHAGTPPAWVKTNTYNGNDVVGDSGTFYTAKGYKAGHSSNKAPSIDTATWRECTR